MKRAVLCVLFIFTTLPLNAKESTPESAWLKFEFVGDSALMVVPVFVNGRGPYKFLVDTGASHSVLSAALAKSLDLKNGRKRQLETADGTTVITTRTVETIQVGEVRIVRPQIAVARLALLDRLQLDGILGGDQLKSFNVFIDYSRRLLRMERQS